MKTFLVIGLLATAFLSSCEPQPSQQQISDSGVRKASVTVSTDQNGQTIEQRNIIQRLKEDNSVGEVKHLYVISSFSGAVMEYSTVVGKVTSGGKRLSPRTVDGGNPQYGANNYVTINGHNYVTPEVLDDGGTYGESMPYVYWFDAQGNYHQYFPSGGTYLHISSRPLTVLKSALTFSSVGSTDTGK